MNHFFFNPRTSQPYFLINHDIDSIYNGKTEFDVNISNKKFTSLREGNYLYKTKIDNRIIMQWSEWTRMTTGSTIKLNAEECNWCWALTRIILLLLNFIYTLSSCTPPPHTKPPPPTTIHDDEIKEEERARNRNTNTTTDDAVDWN